MKTFLWLYSIIGTLYFAMYLEGAEPVVRNAVGVLWFAMMISPFLLMALILRPLAGLLRR